MNRTILRLAALSCCVMMFHAMSGAVRQQWDRGGGIPLPVMLAADSPVDLDVPYVPTGAEVVDEMLKVADVKSGDVLYDLGCGDGRIVVTAARRFDVRCVGVDRDPERIRESNENAARYDVTDKVRFLQQDLFDTDFSEASVLTLYLLPDVNLKLRPKILATLEPGTRVVSHDFDMGEWEPDRVIGVGSRDTVYFWVVPANVSGSWEWDEGGEPYALRIEQRFQKAQGMLTRNGRSLPVRDLTVQGDRISFVVDQNDGGTAAPVTYAGCVSRDRIEGKREGKHAAADGGWTAVRDPATRGAIDRY